MKNLVLISFFASMAFISVIAYGVGSNMSLMNGNQQSTINKENNITEAEYVAQGLNPIADANYSRKYILQTEYQYGFPFYTIVKQDTTNVRYIAELPK